MQHYDSLKKHVLKRVSLTENELEIFCNHFQVTKVKKRQFIIQPNFTAKSRYYVVQGALRAYIVGDEGQDYTIQLAIEDWWISDYNSYIYQQPATMFVIALEASTLLEISFENEKKLKSLNHKYETYFRIIAESSTAYMQRRITTGLTKSAEDRFEHFQERYPQLMQRIPQYALASFLGMTTEYLSKLRNKRVDKKS
ncbi:cAMP-binding domain of CRP or a regulatory subunit of cAMP-dependent protein kinases [Chitinophaga costaii]|uniref:cAMP-binding domain of CRP or a regulatory subunit of cAMP-dependent protein kinases n=1 Tax=Chitinophaga costaii TaxID=1335309 RepID=A0A1C3Z2U4_9BACT|nr:Crp/Fnr family transcriptional regulator [Chitinophaga costaii]PUZ30205.1 Crp/Fnr family transcriptional regulator [Chitinophaga costaii]SCB76588.1 cAMP-binding domain of CRP or a regulatory subunit of cAMP-dependent protein kinases [Chitinophaga costaii]